MSKHTPGPWNRDKYGNVVDSNGERVVMRSVAVACSGSDEYIALAEANTDLATAAPDLLEALEAFERIKDIWLPPDAEEQYAEEMHTLHMARNNMLAAIARAKGESQ